MFYRGRRLRQTPTLRKLMQEYVIRPTDLIMPYFVIETNDQKMAAPIPSMPGQYQLSLKRLGEEVGKDIDAGLSACLLFGLPAEKDPLGSGAYAENGIIQQATRLLKKLYPQLIVITDLCLCEYTSHGHCGILTEQGEVLNDPTLELLVKTAISQAKAGADIIAPSDMMDGRIGAIRNGLNINGFTNTPIMSYAVKYASAYYGPFRDAADSTPKSGDRKSYQMDPANAREAMREAQSDIDQGADILIVKPAGSYLDILHQIRKRFPIPLAAYQVSGEYSMIKAAALNGWVDETSVILESLTGIKRAGADLLITYFASDLLRKRIVS